VLKESGKLSSIKFATFDLSPEVLQAVNEGKMLFAIDQQQFLQGYLPVLILTQYIEYLLHPIGVIPTGPNLVTEDTAQEVIELTKAGIR
jgi:simple sugar transport system substrate-binding protein